MPMTDEEVEDFAVVVVDEESFESELQPAMTSPAKASAAIPAMTRRFFNVFSKVHGGVCAQ